jgi:predicted nucleic acid-binding protein
VPTFVDTNVLVYARDASDAWKHHGALAWMNSSLANGTGRLSVQVSKEYHTVRASGP